MMSGYMSEHLERYFDYAASAPISEAALEAANRCARDYPGNPSAVHGLGAKARKKWNSLKEELCELVSFSDGRLIVTSSATEANNLVWQSWLKQRENSLLMAADVHDSIYASWLSHQDQSKTLNLIDMGSLPLDKLSHLIQNKRTMFAMSHVNNETGKIHDCAALGMVCERAETPVLVDGVQALGHIPLKLDDLSFSAYTFSAHKFSGPRGIGGVFLRDFDLSPQIVGGHQEDGLRAGTENLAGLAGTVAALKENMQNLSLEAEKLRALCNSLVSILKSSNINFGLNSDLEKGSPGLLSISFPKQNGHHLVYRLAESGFDVSTGSACQADREEPSRLILALGHSPEIALGTLRVSFGKFSTEASATALAIQLVDLVKN